MNCSYEYDQDPRYGWVSVNMGDKKEGLIVVQDEGGVCYGFTYSDGKMVATCICNAYSKAECGCGLY